MIYAFKKFEDDYFDRWQVRLLFLEELLDDPENCKNHAFEAVPFQEILGFRVADNEFTKEIIYRAISRVLHTRGSGRNTGRPVWKWLKRAEATMSRICP